MRVYQISSSRGDGGSGWWQNFFLCDGVSHVRVSYPQGVFGLEQDPRRSEPEPCSCVPGAARKRLILEPWAEKLVQNVLHDIGPRPEAA